MKRNFKFQCTREQKILLVLALTFLVCSPSFATGAGAIEAAANNIKAYWGSIKTLIMMIGGIVGLIGGLRIYNKWTNGDQDINKEILGWGGACLFLLLVPTFIQAFFNLT